MLSADRTNIPKYARSFWLQNENLPTFPPLQEGMAVHVTIIGGGAAGITTAYLLANDNHERGRGRNEDSPEQQIKRDKKDKNLDLQSQVGDNLSSKESEKIRMISQVFSH
ncbi:hypothetical protein ACE1TI_09035 [Alteribacillus sp. JSM 102045]|uniref:hypothetical protein n=1 Tax=Alteribacillus sp. JSM 102045 TaxID=1562101 RepID=UPI0035BFF146